MALTLFFITLSANAGASRQYYLQMFSTHKLKRSLCLLFYLCIAFASMAQGETISSKIEIEGYEEYETYRLEPLFLLSSDVDTITIKYTGKIASPYGYTGDARFNCLKVDDKTIFNHKFEIIAGENEHLQTIYDYVEDCRLKVSPYKDNKIHKLTLVYENGDDRDYISIAKSCYFTFKDTSISIDGIKYLCLEDNAVVLSADKNIGTATIKPSVTFEGKSYPVNAIEPFAFNECTQLSELSIPTSIKEIGDFAFASCKSLTSIIIPEEIATIGAGAFSECTGLKTVHYNAVNAVYDNFTNSACGIFHGNNLYSCKFIIGENVSQLPDSLMTSLRVTDFFMPINTQFGASTFTKCTAFRTISPVQLPIESTVSIYYPSDAVFDSNGVIYNKEKTRLYYAPTEITKINIPQSVININAGAFALCSKLKEISIPKGVCSLEDYIFYGCISLESVSLAEGYRDPNIDETIGIGQIGRYAFYNCSSLKQIKLPNVLGAIRKYAFYMCSSLKQLSLPENLASIDDFAFGECSSLQSISFPDHVDYIGSNILTSCPSLKEPVYTQDYFIRFPDSLKIETYAIPEGIRTICDRAFWNNQTLKELTLPESLTNILYYDGIGCHALRKLTLNSADLSIMANTVSAFYHSWDSLQEVTIGPKVRYLPKWTFKNCKNLTTVNFNAENCKINEQNPFGPNVLEANFGSTADTIPDYLFYNCESLAYIIHSPAKRA